jgi:hypothetical protein
LAAAAMLVAAAAGLQAQNTPAQAAAAGQRFVALGCVSRDTSGGNASAMSFILTDTRGAQPTIYRLEGDEKLLTFHVGHTVEVAGPLTPVASDPGKNTFVMKVGQLTYISTSCIKFPAK